MSKKEIEITTYEVVYNACYGGFGISTEAVELARKLWPNQKYWFGDDCKLKNEKFSDGSLCDYDYGSHGRRVPRHSKELLHLVRTLKKKANGSHASLKIEELSGTFYRIEEYDGNESVVQPSDPESWDCATDVDFPKDN